MDIPAVVDANLTRMYKNIFDSLTVDQQQALLRGRVHLPGNPSHNLKASADGPGRGMFTDSGDRVESRAISRIIPMRPLDVGRDWALDYTSPQTIKLYNKATEAVKGDTFDGKYLYSWLARVHDKARAYAWLPVLTINGKILTKSYADVTMEDVRKHAQVYQNEARRGAQNAEQLLLCLQASISRSVYNRVHQLERKYTITREPERGHMGWGLLLKSTNRLLSRKHKVKHGTDKEKIIPATCIHEKCGKGRCTTIMYTHKIFVRSTKCSRGDHNGPPHQPNGGT
jgi:hypothetical protein